MQGDLPDYSDETLLGFLLGGLPAKESSQIESARAQSPDLQQRLADLRELLAPLEDAAGFQDVASGGVAAGIEVYEPRGDLVAETMERIVQASSRGGESTGGLVPPILSQPRTVEWSEAPTATKIAWLDSLVALAAGIIFLSVLLPSVWQWRESARQFRCADNLRLMENAIASFARITGSEKLPAIETQGPLTFAGVYALRLQDHQLLDSTDWVWCSANRTLPHPKSLPSRKAFLAADPDQQQLWRLIAGGNYAFHLGSRIGDQYRVASLDAPVRFAVLGDVWPKMLRPQDQREGGSNVQNTWEEPVRLHGNRAANVLYSDGGVRLVRIPENPAELVIDHPFLNREGRPGVGIGLEDACLGPSFWVPAVDLGLLP